MAALVGGALTIRDRLLGRSCPDPGEATPSVADHAAAGVPHGFLAAADGLRLFYRYWEPAGGRPRLVVLCLHGAGAHGAHFQVVAEHLCPGGAAVCALDLRGHGLSEGRRGDLTRIEAITQDVGTALAFLRETYAACPVYLWGESAGGPLAIKYAAEHGHTLDGLILSSPEIESAVKPSLGEYLQHLPYAILDPEARIVDMTGRLHLCNRGEQDVQRELTDPLRNNRLSSRSVLALYRLTCQVPRLARRIAVPTLILQGGTDLVSKPEAVERFYRALASADKKLVIFPEAYHGLLHDPDTPRVLRAVEQWLEERTTDRQQ